MNKQELKKRLHEESGFTYRQIDRFLELLVMILSEKINNDEKVVIGGFGSFQTKYKKPKQMYNINTKQYVITERKRKVIFTPSSKLLWQKD